MNRRLCIFFILIVSLLALIVGGCRTPVEPEKQDYVEYGWELMADTSYRAASIQFEAGTELDRLYADGWNGLGWAYARLDSAGISDTSFSTGADLVVDDTSIVGTEIMAGRSFANLARGEFAEAVDDAKDALERTPTWEFRRDVTITITYKHLYLTVATGFYGQGEFDSCLVWVQKLDEDFPADTTLSGRSKLAARLQTLKGEL
ncbi:MAG: hypothetical protein GH143_07185 [Calditrichaeota bacterium]|nr:hypothetical protein [Calditrichota bacterium]